MSTLARCLVCPACSAQIAPELLSCPGCGRLVHAERLEALAQAAQADTLRGDTAAALACWREALELLPVNSRQHQSVVSKIDALGRSDASTAPCDSQPRHSNSAGKKAAAGIGGLALLLWKFKVAVVLLLTKGKLLLLGLTKAGTLFSMLLSLGVYWAVWGWKFALGLVLSIYLHEMGHVIAIRRLGMKASAPMFIPGIGALIRLRQHPATTREDAIIGLAGPLYGLGAAAASLGLWVLTRQPILAVIAGVGAWINIFNLLPVWTLDGGRAFRALSRSQRWFAAAAVAAAWLIARDGMLLLLLLVVAWRATTEPGDEKGDRRTAAQYAVLVILLGLISMTRALAPI